MDDPEKKPTTAVTEREQPDADAPPTMATLRRIHLSRRRFMAGGVGAAGVVMALPIVRAQNAPGTPDAATPSPGVVPGMATPQAVASPAAATAATTPTGLAFFSPYDAAIVQAAAARLIPTDENGPGATEAGVVYFIDRQLASEYGFSVQRYNQGPYAPGLPTQGDQSALNLRDRYRLGCAALDAYAQQLYQNGFASLTPDQQDRILTDLSNDTPNPFSVTAMTTQPFEGPTEPSVDPAAQSGIGAQAFFQLLLQHTIAGFFCDPVQGGNQGMVGWQLIGFPGAHMDYADYIENYGQPYTGPMNSLADYQLQMTGQMTGGS